MAAQYDRFPLQGGLDTITPYISRNPGTLLACINFHPDANGGYAMSGGFERFDGKPAPSETVITNLYLSAAPQGIFAGQYITDVHGGHNSYVGRVYDSNIWLDDLGTGWSVNDTLTDGAGNTLTVLAVATEAIDNRSYDPIATRTNINIVTAQGGKSIHPGTKMLGLTSGVQMTVNNLKETPTGYWLYVTYNVGQPLQGEVLRADDLSEYTYDGGYDVEPMLSNPDTPAGTFFFLSEERRSLISIVPGQGPVRGVWEFEGTVYAIRDNMVGTAAALWASSPAGWSAVPLGYTMGWDTRPTTVNDDGLGTGDEIQGVTSGAKAVVGWVGYIAQDHKSGYVAFKSLTGTFQAGETLKNNTTGVADIGKVTAAATLNTLPPGGDYNFLNHNFFGGTDRNAMYAAGGVSPAWCYNTRQGFSFLPTGRAEFPYDLAEYKESLWLGFPLSLVQFSAVGNPFDWSGMLGAGEFSVGAEVSSFIASPKSLIICTEKDVQYISGDDVENFQKDLITEHDGVAKGTGKYQSQSLVLGRAGIIGVDRTDQFGNFADAVISNPIRDIILPLFSQSTGALARKDLRQYRLHFENDANICFTSSQGEIVGFSMFDHGGLTIRNSCCPYGRVFFTSDDGFVYHDDVGGSNDGNERVSVFRTSFAHQGDPDTRKRFRRIDMTLKATSFVNFRVNFAFDKANGVPQSSIQSGLMVSQGGFWDLSNWNQVFWDASDAPTVSSDVDGVGADIGTMVYVQSRIHPPFTVQDISFEWSPRRKMR